MHVERAVHTLGGLPIASGSSAWWNTDSRKATKGGETCSSMRAKRSRRSLMIVSRWTSPAGSENASFAQYSSCQPLSSVCAMLGAVWATLSTACQPNLTFSQVGQRRQVPGPPIMPCCWDRYNQ